MFLSVGANRLRELRKKIGKSQEIVGGLLNISQSRMSDYENGICAIPSDALILFADYYKVTTDYILGLSDNQFGGGASVYTLDTLNRILDGQSSFFKVNIFPFKSAQLTYTNTRSCRKQNPHI